MHGLTAWKEIEISRMRKDLESIFKRRCRDFGIPPFIEGSVLPLDLEETESELILTSPVSGIRPEDIDISASEDSITVQVAVESRNVTEDGLFRKVEQRAGTYRRRISLPVRVRVEDIKAEYDDRGLRIVMPKCDPSKRRSIKVQIL